MGERVALVTGSNRGIGLETARQLAKLGLKVLMTSRDGSGEALAAAMRAEGLAADHEPLEVTDAASVAELAGRIERRRGRLDVLVNNAGVLLDEEIDPLAVGLDIVRRTLEVNTLGPLALCQALVPLMRRHGYGRIVNVSSEMGQLNGMGGGSLAYRVSKTALNAVTSVLASATMRSGILVNACCPGWVRTAMGGPGASLSVAEGADTVVWLATLPDGGPTGGFFQGRERLEW
ncbi:MAG TPA: SDR family oxidoreductase [Herpetosiphonaceae bacterium]